MAPACVEKAVLLARKQILRSHLLSPCIRRDCATPLTVRRLRDLYIE